MTKNQFIFVLLVTFTVIVIWIVADIIHTKPSVPVDPKLQNLLDPVNPNFDNSALNKISENQIPVSIRAGIGESSSPAVIRR